MTKTAIFGLRILVTMTITVMLMLDSMTIINALQTLEVLDIMIDTSVNAGGVFCIFKMIKSGS